MYEYNNKQFMTHVVESLKNENKAKITIADIEKYIPEETTNRRVIALRLMRQLIDHRILAANDMDGHSFLSADCRVRNSKELLTCQDWLTLLVLMGEDEKDFEALCDDLNWQDPIPLCFSQKCVQTFSTCATKYIEDMYEAVYCSLERLIYAEMVEESSEGCFQFIKDEDDPFDGHGKIYESIIDRCFSCDTFRKYIQEEHSYLLEDLDFDEEDDELDDEILCEEDLDRLLEDFEGLQQKLKKIYTETSVDSSGASAKSKDESQLLEDVDILERLRAMYKKD